MCVIHEMAEELRAKEKMAKVECATCGWKGKRKTGKLVDCPDCQRPAAFQIETREQALDELTRLGQDMGEY